MSLTSALAEFVGPYQNIFVKKKRNGHRPLSLALACSNRRSTATRTRRLRSGSRRRTCLSCLPLHLPEVQCICSHAQRLTRESAGRRSSSCAVPTPPQHRCEKERFVHGIQNRDGPRGKAEATCQEPPEERDRGQDLKQNVLTSFSFLNQRSPPAVIFFPEEWTGTTGFYFQFSRQEAR